MDRNLILLLPERFQFAEVKDHRTDQPESEQHKKPDSKLKLAVCHGKRSVVSGGI